MTNESYNSPRNRRSVSLGILDVEIEGAEGVYNTDPNGTAMMAVTGEYPNLTPIAGLKSEISGKPAYYVRVDDIQMALSFEEMDRFFRHALRKREVEYLIERYGMFHEVHGDFYVEGYAWQPIKISFEVKQRKAYEKKVEEARKLQRRLEKELKKKEKHENKMKM